MWSASAHAFRAAARLSVASARTTLRTQAPVSLLSHQQHQLRRVLPPRFPALTSLSAFPFSSSSAATPSTAPQNSSSSSNNNNTQKDQQQQQQQQQQKKNDKQQQEQERRAADESATAQRNRRYALYLGAVIVGGLGLTYLTVPLYTIFCQMTGFGGTVKRDVLVAELNSWQKKMRDLDEERKSEPMRLVTVRFQAHVSKDLDWEFRPCQQEIKLRIGDTALAFYEAKSNMDKAFIGVSTYNVIPPQVGVYFNKIQCFCFDEQRLRAGESVDMPILFYLDPAMAEDWRLDGVTEVTLAYTFFPLYADDDDQTPYVPKDREPGAVSAIASAAIAAGKTPDVAAAAAAAGAGAPTKGTAAAAAATAAAASK